jgi:hypothetical protein
VSGAAQMMTVQEPLAIHKQGGRKLVVTPSGSMNRNAAGADSPLLKALARAFQWRRMLEMGRYMTIDELTAAESINGYYVCRILPSHATGTAHRRG